MSSAFAANNTAPVVELNGATDGSNISVRLSGAATASITVNAVNDAPRFTEGNGPTSTTEQSNFELIGFSRCNKLFLQLVVVGRKSMQ